MAYKEISSFNTSEGVQVIFKAAAEASPKLFPLILFGVYLVVMLGSYFSQKRLTGRGHLPASAAAAGILTLVVAVVLSFIPGLIPVGTVTFSLVIAILGVVWLFISRN